MKLLLVIALSLYCAGSAENAAANDANAALIQRFSKAWPDKDDLAWFQRAKGQSEKEIVNNYGKPLRRVKLADGRVRWIYPWTAVAYLEFTDGIVTSVFYTAGF